MCILQNVLLQAILDCSIRIFLFKCLIAVFSDPLHVCIDNGNEFHGMFEAICALYNIQLICNLQYYSRSKVLAENIYCTIKTQLYKVIYSHSSSHYSALINFV